jgi:hypothetical protein
MLIDVLSIGRRRPFNRREDEEDEEEEGEEDRARSQQHRYHEQRASTDYYCASGTTAAWSDAPRSPTSIRTMDLQDANRRTVHKKTHPRVVATTNAESHPLIRIQRDDQSLTFSIGNNSCDDDDDDDKSTSSGDLLGLSIMDQIIYDQDSLEWKLRQEQERTTKLLPPPIDWRHDDNDVEDCHSTLHPRFRTFDSMFYSAERIQSEFFFSDASGTAGSATDIDEAMLPIDFF